MCYLELPCCCVSAWFMDAMRFWALLLVWCSPSKVVIVIDGTPLLWNRCDLLGFYLPTALSGKKILQQLWKLWILCQLLWWMPQAKSYCFTLYLPPLSAWQDLPSPNITQRWTLHPENGEWSRISFGVWSHLVMWICGAACFPGREWILYLLGHNCFIHIQYSPSA